MNHDPGDPPRQAKLRHALAFLRTSRDHLRAGELAKALRYHHYAVGALAFIRGALSACPGGVRAMDCTAGLRRAVAELGFAIEAAVRERTARE